MKRNWINFVVDALTAVVMLGIVITGLLLKFVIPAGQGGRLALWGRTKHEWGDVHFWLAVGALGLTVAHVALHWGWVCAMAQRMVRPGSIQNGPWRGWARNSAGAALVVLLAIGLWGFVVGAKASVKTNVAGTSAEARSESHGRDEGGGQGPRWGRGEGGGGRGRGGGGQGQGVESPATSPSHAEDDVRGSSTLADIAKLRGVSVEQLKAKLGLPSDTPVDMRLSWLRRDYNLSMDQVRQAVDELAPKPTDP